MAVAYTIRRMVEYAREDAASAVVRACVLDALQYSASDSWRSIASALHGWLRTHIVFEDDEIKGVEAGFGSGHEVLVRPVDLLSMTWPSGDCDCFSMAFASMMLRASEMYRLRCRVYFVTVATHADEPGQFTHVYACATSACAGKLDVLPVDSSHGTFAGWEVANRYGKKAYWPVGGPNDMFAKAIAYRPLSGLHRSRRPLGCTGYGGLSPATLGRLGDDPLNPVGVDNQSSDNADDAPWSSLLNIFGGSDPLNPVGVDNQSSDNADDAPWSTATTYSKPGDSTNWTSVINNLIASGATVAKADVTGTTIRMPNGQTITYAGVTPSGGQITSATSALGGMSPTLLIGGLVVGVVVIFAMGKR